MKRFGVFFVVLALIGGIAAVIAVLVTDLETATSAPAPGATLTPATPGVAPEASKATLPASAPAPAATTVPIQTAEPEGDGALSGIVVDHMDRPLASAQVIARELNKPGTRRSERLSRMDDYTAITDREGRFVISALPAAEWTIEAQLEGYISKVQRRESTASTGDHEIKMVLVASATISGRVLDAERLPIPGIYVHAVRITGGGWSGTDGFRTDDEGRFTLKDLSAGQYEVYAIDLARGTARAEFTLVIGEHRKDLELTLDPGLSIAGRVQYPDGAPVAGARIEIERSQGHSAGLNSEDPIETDADGTFVIRGLESGLHELTVRNQSRLISSSKSLIAGVEHVVIVLPRGATVRGSVVRADGAAATDGTLTISITDGNASYGRGTNYKESRFEVVGLPTGEMQISASDAEHGTSEPVVFALSEGAVIENVLLIVGTTVSVSGSVIDDAGAALADANVQAWTVVENQGGGQSRSGVVNSNCNQDGKFVLPGLTEGERYFLEAKKPGCFDASAEGGAWVVGGNEGIVLTLTKGGIVEGRVSLGGAEPVAGAQVEVELDNGRRASRPPRASPFGRLDLQARSDRDGHYRIVGLPAGSYQLTCRIDEFPQPPALPFDIALGQHLTDINFELEVGGVITGSVVDQHDLPISEAQVSARLESKPDGPAIVRVRTDEAGRFKLRGLVASAHVLSVEKRGLTLAPGQPGPLIVATGSEVVIRMASLGVVIGTVRTSDASKLDRFEVGMLEVDDYAENLLRANLIQQQTFPGDPGEFELQLEDDPKKVKAVMVTADGYLPALVSLNSFSATGVNDVGKIVLDSGGVIEVRVLDPEGAPLAGASVNRHLEPDEAGHKPQFDLNEISESRRETEVQGEVRFTNLVPGKYRIEVEHAEFIGESVNVVVPASGSVAPITLRMTRGAAIFGRVSLAGGAPAASVFVDASLQTAERPSSRSTRTAVDGSYRIGGLPAGTYRVLASNLSSGSNGDTRSLEQQIEVPENGTVECNFAIDSGCRVHGIVRGLRERDGQAPASISLQKVAAITGGFTGSTEVAPDGAYEFANVRAGVYLLRRPDGVEVPVTVPEASELRLDLQLPGGVLRGRVARADGEPFTSTVSVVAHLRGADGGIATLRTEHTPDSGVFEITNLEPGVYDIQARIREFGSGLLEGVQLGRDEQKGDLEILIAQNAVIIVRVLDASGAPQGGASLTLVHIAGMQSRPIASRSQQSLGVWRITELVPGMYRVIAELPDLPLIWQDGVNVRAGAEAEVAIRVPAKPAGAPISLTFSDPASADGVMISITDSKSLHVFSRSTHKGWRAPDGSFQTSLLPSGVYTVRARSRMNQRAEAAVTVPEGGAPVALMLTLQ